MKARKCDRCGKFYDDYKPTEETKNANALRLMGGHPDQRPPRRLVRPLRRVHERPRNTPRHPAQAPGGACRAACERR